MPFCFDNQDDVNPYRLYRKMNRKATRLFRLQERLERTAEALRVREARLQQLESRLYGEASQGVLFGTGGGYDY